VFWGSRANTNNARRAAYPKEKGKTGTYIRSKGCKQEGGLPEKKHTKGPEWRVTDGGEGVQSEVINQLGNTCLHMDVVTIFAHVPRMVSHDLFPLSINKPLTSETGQNHEGREKIPSEPE